MTRMIPTCLLRLRYADAGSPSECNAAACVSLYNVHLLLLAVVSLGDKAVVDFVVGLVVFRTVTFVDDTDLTPICSGGVAGEVIHAVALPVVVGKLGLSLEKRRVK